MNVRFYTSKHATIKQLLTALKQAAGDGISERNGIAVFALLSKLASTLSSHLATEDEHLYPQLLASPIPSVRETARLYQEKMLDISAFFKQFIETFSEPAAIFAQKDLFLEQFTLLDVLLRDRIDKEENELYCFL